MQDLNRAYRQLESKFMDDRATLSQLIEHLSNLCLGHTAEFDQQLNQLKAKLAQNIDLEGEREFIQALIQQLIEQKKLGEQRLIEAKDSVLASGTLLQKTRGLELSTQKELAALIRQIMSPATAQLELLPLVVSLSRMYSNSLRYLYTQKGLPTSELEREVSPFFEPNQCTQELEATLKEFEFSPEITAQIEAQRQRLSSIDTPKAFADVCTHLMRILLQSIQLERSGSEQFLSRLNSSLERINQALDKSLDASAKLHELQEETESQIRQQLAGLSTVVEQGTKLDELKVKINDRLTLISQLLEKRSKQSALEKQLQTSLSQMKERLSTLEKEARLYQTQLNEQRQKLYIDALTSVPNRASFDERFETEFERAKNYKRPLTLAILDIDHFKKINDSFGHTAGDKTLSALGRLLKKWLRHSDFVARYGGEEFVVLLPDVSTTQALPLLQKLCKNVAAVPFVYRGQNLQMTISIGAAQASLAQTSLDLFELADKALYQAKNGGRNQVVIAE